MEPLATSAICEACGASDFHSADDGFFYCNLCGSQSQNLIQTAAADADLFGTADAHALYNPHHYARSQHQSQSQAAFLPDDEAILAALNPNTNPDPDPVPGFEAEERPRDFGEGGGVVDAEEVVRAIRGRYVQGVQVLVELQVEVLVERFGVSPVVCGLVGGVWLRFLKAMGVFEDGWGEMVIRESEAKVREQAGDEEPVCRRIRAGERGEPHSMYGKRAIFIWWRYLKKVIPLHSSLAILLLACHIARQSILPTDIIRWSLEAKLPYICAFSEIDKLLGKPSNACLLRSKTLFRPHHVVGTWQLEAMAGFIAKSIGLCLPPVNFHAIASRYLTELSLPLEKILPSACRIYEWSMPIELYLSTNRLKIPSRVYVLAILVIAMRILYKIDNKGVWEAHCIHLDRPISDKNNYLPKKKRKRKRKRKSDLNLPPGGNADVSEPPSRKLPHDESSDYNTLDLLSRLQSAYKNISNIRNDYSKDFKSYLHYCKDVIVAGVPKTYEEDTLIEKFWEIYEKQENAGPSLDEPGFDDTNQNQKASGDEAVNKHHVSGNSEIKQHLHRHSLIEGPENTALNKLKLDMEENGFLYLSPDFPKIANNQYLQYIRKKTWGKFYYVAHADYFILLRACARLAEVDCRIMHLGVLYLERRLTWTEKRIESSLVAFHEGSVEAMIELPQEEFEEMMS